MYRQGVHVSDMLELARTMEQCGNADQIVSSMASLGSHGTHPQNAERDLHLWMANLHRIELEPCVITVRVKSEKPNQDLKLFDLAILPPYELIAAIYKLGHHVIERCWLGPGGMSSCAEYWRNALRLEWGRQHPALQRNHPLEMVWPVQYHMDDAEFYTGTSYRIVSCSSPLVTKRWT